MDHGRNGIIAINQFIPASCLSVNEAVILPSWQQSIGNVCPSHLIKHSCVSEHGAWIFSSFFWLFSFKQFGFVTMEYLLLIQLLIYFPKGKICILFYFVRTLFIGPGCVKLLKIKGLSKSFQHFDLEFPWGFPWLLLESHFSFLCLWCEGISWVQVVTASQQFLL